MGFDVESLKKTRSAIGQSATLTSLGASAGAIMAIVALLGFLRIDVIPFAWASDVDDIKQSIERLTDVIEQQTVSNLETQRENYRLQLEDAREDLEKNPDSRSAKNEVIRLEQAIKDIDRKLEKLK